MIPLSLINADHGILIDNVIEFLRLFKFPIKLPNDIFWPKYEEAAKRLFWKHRYKISKYEGEPFILCNEQLIMILYLTFWILWLVLVGIQKCKEDDEKDDCKNQKDSSPFSKKRGSVVNRVKIAPYALRQKIHRERLSLHHEQIKLSSHMSNENDHEEEKVDEASPPNSHKMIMMSRQNQQNSKNQQKGEKKVENKFEGVVTTIGNIREFFYLFGSFDIQFIAWNELLHSDITQIDRFKSNATLSLILSFICLSLLIIDHWWFLEKSYKITKKIQMNSKLTKNEESDKELIFEEIEINPSTSTIALNFNQALMMRFSIYQVVIVSLQLLPILQSGTLLGLHLWFFIYFSIKYKKEKFFESRWSFGKYFIFEICLTVFLVISFIFTFKTLYSNLSTSFIGWLQIIAVGLIFICLFIELATLFTKMILDFLDLIKFLKSLICLKKKGPVAKQKDKEVVIHSPSGFDLFEDSKPASPSHLLPRRPSQMMSREAEPEERNSPSWGIPRNSKFSKMAEDKKINRKFLTQKNDQNGPKNSLIYLNKQQNIFQTKKTDPNRELEGSKTEVHQKELSPEAFNFLE